MRTRISAYPMCPRRAFEEQIQTDTRSQWFRRNSLRFGRSVDRHDIAQNRQRVSFVNSIAPNTEELLSEALEQIPCPAWRKAQTGGRFLIDLKNDSGLVR